MWIDKHKFTPTLKRHELHELSRKYYTKNDRYLTKAKAKSISKCIRLTNSSMMLLNDATRPNERLNRDTMEVTEELFEQIEKLKPKY
jgi:thiaminase